MSINYFGKISWYYTDCCRRGIATYHWQSILRVLKSDILNVTCYQQLCGGLGSGCEVAVHAVVDLFEEDTTHGFIQIDASKAFNSINQTLLLHNVKILCPEIATCINNCYMKPFRLFITG